MRTQKKTVNWFKEVKTLEDLKSLYRQYAMKYHPDKGGDTATMAEINDEYSRIFEQVKNTHRDQNNEYYTADAGKETNEMAEDFIAVINAIMFCAGLEIELCGKWLWITGNTYEHRETLKNAGCLYSRNKSAWYWHGGNYRKRNGKDYCLDDIREKYGSERVVKREPMAIA